MQISDDLRRRIESGDLDAEINEFMAMRAGKSVAEINDMRDQNGKIFDIKLKIEKEKDQS